MAQRHKGSSYQRCRKNQQTTIGDVQKLRWHKFWLQKKSFGPKQFILKQGISTEVGRLFLIIFYSSSIQNFLVLQQVFRYEVMEVDLKYFRHCKCQFLSIFSKLSLHKIHIKLISFFWGNSVNQMDCTKWFF